MLIIQAITVYSAAVLSSQGQFPFFSSHPREILLLIVLGLLVGFLVGLTSIGAGGIATPLLILLADVPPLLAVGTAIVAGAATKGIGLWKYEERGLVDWRLVRFLLWGSLPGMGIAVSILYRLRHEHPASTNLWVGRLVGLALLFLGLSALARDWRWMRRWQAAQNDLNVPRRAFIIGAVVGLVFGITSIGTGSLVVVLLSLLLSLSEIRIVASAVAYGFVLSLITGFSHIVLGTVNWPLTASLLMGSLPGVLLGSELAVRTPKRFLRICFSIGAILAGWKLF